MDNILNGAFLVLFILSLVYIIFLRPKMDEKNDALEFDSLVLGFFDGLYLSGAEIPCTDYELRYDVRSYLMQQLSKAHLLPGNQLLIEYRDAKGYVYCSHISKNNHALFVILCIAQYAKNQGNRELLSWAESKMEDSRRFSASFLTKY